MQEKIFIQEAKENGFSKKLASSLIKLVGGYENFIQIVEDSKLQVFLNSISTPTIVEDDFTFLVPSSRVFVDNPLVIYIDRQDLEVFYDKHCHDIKTSFECSSLTRELDTEDHMLTALIYIPEEFIEEFLSNPSLISSMSGYEYMSGSQFKWLIVQHALYLLVYEYMRQANLFDPSLFAEVDLSTVRGVSCSDAQVHIESSPTNKQCSFFLGLPRLAAIEALEYYYIDFMYDAGGSDSDIMYISISQRKPLPPGYEHTSVHLTLKNPHEVFVSGKSAVSGFIGTKKKSAKCLNLCVNDNSLCSLEIHCDELEFHLSDNSITSLTGATETIGDSYLNDSATLLAATFDFRSSSGIYASQDARAVIYSPNAYFRNKLDCEADLFNNRYQEYEGPRKGMTTQEIINARSK